MEVLENKHLIQFLLLGENGLSKTAAGEEGWQQGWTDREHWEVRGLEGVLGSNSVTRASFLVLMALALYSLISIIL